MNDNQSTSLSRRFFSWWADRWGLQTLVVLLVSGVALLGYTDPSWVRGLFVAEQTDYQQGPPGLPGPAVDSSQDAPPDVEPFEVGESECVVVVTGDDFFTPESLQALREVAADLQALPQVSRVLWLDSVPGLNLFGLPGSLLPPSSASSRQMQLARQRTLDNPLAVGQLISADGKTLLLHLKIDWFYVTSDDACTTELRQTAEAAAARVPGAQFQFQVTGPAPLHIMIAQNHVQDSFRYQVIGYTFMLVTALVLFRGLSAVTIVALAPALGVFWTLGILRLFDLQNNPFNDTIVPVLISLVGLTDAVHLMVEIRNQRAAGHETAEAARRGLARVGTACVLTSLTTAVGFVSLAWAHHEVVQEFGWSCMLGVGLTFVAVLTAVPLGCASPLGRRLHVGLGRSVVDRQLPKVGPLVLWILRRDRLIAWIAIATTVGLAAICTQLQPDQKRYTGLSDSGEAAQALRHLDRSLGGLEFSRVGINWGPQADDGEVLQVLSQVDRALAEEPLIAQPIGLQKLLAALPGEGPPAERMTLLELLPASVKRAYYLPESRQAWVQFRVQDLGIAQYGVVFDRLETQFQEISKRHPDFALRLEGRAVWRWQHVYRVLIDLATSLGTASIVIWLILTVVYRSLRIGLISLVPNLFPLVATGAILYFAGQRLEMVTVCVFTICIGIAVDDTIHFLTRYQEETARAQPHQQAIRNAFTGVGSALLMTTIVLVTGMLTAVFGDVRDARVFGIMGATTLASALFADIFFLPALLSRFGQSHQDASA